jgi:hypothetical protein
MASDSSSVQFVVTATQTITNDAYRAAADGNLSAVGQDLIASPVVRPIIFTPHNLSMLMVAYTVGHFHLMDL